MKPYLFFILVKIFLINKLLVKFLKKITQLSLRLPQSIVNIVHKLIIFRRSKYKKKEYFSYKSLINDIENFFAPTNSFFVAHLSNVIENLDKFYYKRKVRDIYPYYEYLGEINDCIAIGNSRLIISNQSHILHDENFHFKNEFDADFKDNLKKYNKTLHLIEFESRGFLRNQEHGINLMNKYNVNYFHFIVETVPKIIFINEKFKDKTVPFIFEAGLHQNIIEIIHKLNIHNHPLVFLEPGELCFFKKLILCSDFSTVVDNYYGGNSKEKSFINTVYLKKFVSFFRNIYSIKHELKNKNYLKRVGHYRNVLNNNKIIDFCVENSITVINAGNLNISDQIKHASNSSLIISSSGAQLVNMIWAPKGANIVILTSEHPAHQLNMWGQLASVSDVDIHFVKGKNPNLTEYFSKYGLHANYIVEIDSIKNKLNELQKSIII